jgi:hypothetical protein
MKSQALGVSLGAEDYVGFVECQLAQIMGGRGASYTGRIVNNHSRARSVGTITIRGEEVKNANAKVSIQFAGEKLDNKARAHTCTCARVHVWCWCARCRL